MKRVTVAIALVSLLLGYGLRTTNLDAQSFWNDEGNSARLAERSPQLIIEGAAGDIHPPGYYLLLAGWRGLAGESEFTLRYFSVVASVGACAVTFALGRRLFSPAVGGLAVLLVALSPFQVYYAQEARMYALLALLSVASLLLTAEVLTLPGEMAAGRFNARRAVLVIGGYVLVNAAGLYTHYVFPLIIGAETLVFLMWLARRRKKGHGLAVWVMLQGATLLLYAPWVGIAVRQVTGWPTGGPDGASLAAFLTAQAYGLTLSLPEAAYGMLPLLTLTVLGLFPPLTPADRYLHFSERLGLVAITALIMPAALLTVGANSAAFLKFLLPANLALLIIVARGVIIGWRLAHGQKVLRLAVGGLSLLMVVPLALGLNNLYANPTYARADYRAIAERIQTAAGDQAAVVLTAPNQWEVFTYYYPDGPGVTPLPDGQTEATLDRLLTDYDRIFAIFWGEGQQDPEASVESILDARAFPVTDEWVQDVRFVTYAVPAEPATHPDQQPDVAVGEQGIRLEGYSVSQRRVPPGGAFGVTAFWQTTQPIETPYKVFVHLVGSDGGIITQHDSQPAGDLRPTPGWQVGETIIDNHGLIVPPDTPAGDYRLIMGMYDPATLDRLPFGTGEDTFDLGMLTIEP